VVNEAAADGAVGSSASSSSGISRGGSYYGGDEEAAKKNGVAESVAASAWRGEKPAWPAAAASASLVKHGAQLALSSAENISGEKAKKRKASQLSPAKWQQSGISL